MRMTGHPVTTKCANFEELYFKASVPVKELLKLVNIWWIVWTCVWCRGANLKELKMADQKEQWLEKQGRKWRTKSQGWKMQDLENNRPGYIKVGK